jgi:hypothetical protein
MQRAEVTPKIQVLCRRHVLIAKKDHAVCDQRTFDFLQLKRRGRSQIHATDLGPDHRRERLDSDRRVGLRRLNQMANARALLS